MILSRPPVELVGPGGELAKRTGKSPSVLCKLNIFRACKNNHLGKRNNNTTTWNDPEWPTTAGIHWFT